MSLPAGSPTHHRPLRRHRSRAQLRAAISADALARYSASDKLQLVSLSYVRPIRERSEAIEHLGLVTEAVGVTCVCPRADTFSVASLTTVAPPMFFFAGTSEIKGTAHVVTGFYQGGLMDPAKGWGVDGATLELGDLLVQMGTADCRIIDPTLVDTLLDVAATKHRVTIGVLRPATGALHALIDAFVNDAIALAGDGHPRASAGCAIYARALITQQQRADAVAEHDPKLEWRMKCWLSSVSRVLGDVTAAEASARAAVGTAEGPAERAAALGILAAALPVDTSATEVTNTLWLQASAAEEAGDPEFAIAALHGLVQQFKANR